MYDQAEGLRRLTMAADLGRKVIKQKKIPRVITVTSGKGGVGKTNLVVNLAIALSRLGKRVIILDADLGMANVDIILGLLPMYNLLDVVNGIKSLEDIIVSGPQGIKLVPGGSGLLELASLAAEQREHLLKVLLGLEELADILLVDTGAGLSREVLSFISAADELIVITTPEPTAITDAYGIIKVVAKYGIHKEVNLVVNQVRDHEEGKNVALRFNEVSGKFLKMDIHFLGEICNDQHVVRAVKQQQALIELFPSTRASVNIISIAEKLLDIKPEKVRGINGFIDRLSRMLGNKNIVTRGL